MKPLAGFVLAVCLGCNEPRSGLERAVPAGEVKITQFYGQQLVAPGDTATLCYGVENAATVRLDPPVERVWPTLSRCFEVTPKATTRYLLTAGGGGREVSQALEVRVDAAAAKAATPQAVEALIQFFTADPTEIAPGGRVTICYGVRGASAVRIQPQVRQLKPEDRSCFLMVLESTTTFKLVATADGGKRDEETLVIKVR